MTTQKIEWYYGSRQELWTDIGNLDYDTLLELFGILEWVFDNPRYDEWIYLAQSKIIAKRLSDLIQSDIQPLADLCRKHNANNNQHRTHVDKYSYSLDTLWHNIRQLESHTLIELFQILSQKFYQDAQADNDRGRPIISNHIKQIAVILDKIVEENLI